MIYSINKTIKKAGKTFIVVKKAQIHFKKYLCMYCLDKHMSRKSKGINAERELVHLFWEANGWSAIRVAGSGSSPFPCPDVLAGNRIRKLAIECKTVNAKSKYLTEKEINQLNKFSGVFGAEPWIGVKFKSDWFFLSIDDLKKTEKGYAISKDLARKKGLLLDELIEK